LKKKLFGEFSQVTRFATISVKPKNQTLVV